MGELYERETVSTWTKARGIIKNEIFKEIKVEWPKIKENEDLKQKVLADIVE